MNLRERIEAELNVRRTTGALRSLSVKSGLVDLCSNDYLGFATEGVLQSYLASSPHRGSTGSRLLSGNSHLAEETEKRVAHAFQGEAALIFGGGYDANLGLFSALGSRSTTILYDELIHASARDGIRLGNSRSAKFAHNDLGDLQTKLERTAGEKIVAVESLYSMDGDLAPLEALADLCDAYDASLIVDEAHSTGVYGTGGEGLTVQLGLANRVFARVHTFGKALGCHGGAVIGSAGLREFLINFSRPFIYATAPSNEFFEAIHASLAALCSSTERRSELWEHIEQFGQFVKASDLASRCRPNASPIQTIIIPGNSEAKRVAAEMERAGFDARPILSPTVPKGSERLRISLHTHNNEAEIVTLITSLDTILGKPRRSVHA